MLESSYLTHLTYTVYYQLKQIVAQCSFESVELQKVFQVLTETFREKPLHQSRMLRERYCFEFFTCVLVCNFCLLCVLHCGT